MNTGYYFGYFFIIINLCSCVAQKNEVNDGVLSGTIGVFEGNCMPGPGVPPCEPRPISTTVYITQLKKEFDWTFLIDSVESGDDGRYEIKLTPGTYSLFLKDENSIICDLIQCPDECYCHPFEIKEDSTTLIDANLDHATW